MWSYFVICSLFSVSNGLDAIGDIDTRKICIEFNPYVSLWDEFEHEMKRYAIDQLVLMISKVASRFSKIYINLDDDRFGESNRTSLLLSLLAAAKYNCQNHVTNQIEVWLGITRAHCGCDSLHGLTEQAVSLANSANIECFGTVTTILIRQNRLYPGPYCKISRCQQNLTDRYTWAVLATHTDYCDGNIDPYELFNPAFIVLEYLKEIELLQNLTQCKFKTARNAASIDIRKMLDFSDTREDKVLNMSGLVNIWKVWLSGCNKCILSQAFDSYNYKTQSWQTNGWWHPVQDAASTEPEKYTFQEKLFVARNVDREQSPREFGWLKRSKNNNKKTTGIKYEGKISFDVLNNFCLVLTNQRFMPMALQLRNTTGKFLLSCKATSHLVVPLDSEIISDAYIDQISEAEWDNITSLFYVPNNRFRDEWFYPNSSVTQLFKNAELQYGYEMDTRICYHLTRNETFYPTDFKNKLLDILVDPNSKMYLFSFDETENAVKLGATRRFQQRIVMFESCRKMVLSNRNTTTQIAYSMTRFYKEQNHYSSPVDMQNFVKFIDLMTAWVNQHENTMAFIGPDTGRDKDSVTEPSAGWYIYDTVNNQYIGSREQALKLSNTRYPDQNNYLDSSLGTNQIILIVIISLVIFTTLFALSAYFIRRKLKESGGSDYNIRIFFNGEQKQENGNNANNVPYDKEKYEIPDSQFKIETSALLGSGEFGSVCRGTISTSTGDMSVAIKTTNPRKQHKTMLNGLLSEVKVLAFIGKHENITELLGANTSSLKDGKVYVFLELCHMGSLEKYLRETRSLVKTTLAEVDENVEMDYGNACPMARNMLDASLSEDLYRWSTEICNGMAYLGEKHVVHADLATRNVLLNLRREAKICDFGLSRRMYNYTNYVKTQQEPLPWKWMAPESLRYMQFNEKTDVWAYGITLWEIYSLGSTPYAGLSWNINFVQMLEAGLTLSELEFSDESRNTVLDVIEECRKILPEERPKFDSIFLWLTKQADKKLKNTMETSHRI